jgi:hypothetical protein
MEKTRTSSTIFVLVALILFVVLFVFFLYTFLHEGGHAITGLLFGQSLTEFNVNFWNFSAHVGMVGGELTQAQLAVRALAGAGLPLVIWTIFISLVPRKANFTLEALKLIASIAVVNTLLPWIILPILFLLGKAPSDDVVNFLRYSQMPPLLLAGTSLVLYIGGWILFLSKIDGLQNELLLFSTTNHEQLITGARTTLSVMASMIAFCAITVFTLNGLADKNSLNKFSPPQDFVSVAQIDLSTRAYPSETLTQFTLDKPTYVGVFIAIRNINTTYFDISVTGANGYSSIVVHGEGYNAAQDGGLWEENLPAGTYQLVLTSHQSPGIASVYMKTY